MVQTNKWTTRSKRSCLHGSSGRDGETNSKARNSANDTDLRAVLYTGESKEYITLSTFSIAPEWAANGFLKEAFLLILLI